MTEINLTDRSTKWPDNAVLLVLSLAALVAPLLSQASAAAEKVVLAPQTAHAEKDEPSLNAILAPSVQLDTGRIVDVAWTPLSGQTTSNTLRKVEVFLVPPGQGCLVAIDHHADTILVRFMSLEADSKSFFPVDDLLEGRNITGEVVDDKGIPVSADLRLTPTGFRSDLG